MSIYKALYLEINTRFRLSHEGRNHSMQIEKYPVTDLEEGEEDCVDYSQDPF